MNNTKINLGKILSKHIGQTFYSPLCGECNLVSHQPYITILSLTGQTYNLELDGTYCAGGEVMLYPSKTERDWEKWLNENTPDTLSYDEVKDALFKTNVYNSVFECGNDKLIKVSKNADNINAYNCTSAEQLLKLQAFNKLMNVQKYIEGGKQPVDIFDNDKAYFHLSVNPLGNVVVALDPYATHCDPYFSTEENAQKAIEILGEDVIKQALNTLW